jgi:hypothetical protein
MVPRRKVYRLGRKRSLSHLDDNRDPLGLIVTQITLGHPTATMVADPNHSRELIILGSSYLGRASTRFTTADRSVLEMRYLPLDYSVVLLVAKRHPDAHRGGRTEFKTTVDSDTCMWLSRSWAGAARISTHTHTVVECSGLILYY